MTAIMTTLTSFCLKGFHRHVLLGSTKRFYSSSPQWSERTHTCGELRRVHADQRVSLSGWVQFVRMNKFLLLRDFDGLTQIFCSSPLDKQLRCLTLESVIKVEGTVRMRPPGQENASMATGEVEVEAETLTVLSPASKDIPFLTRDYAKAKEETQLRYRYLSFRYPEMQQCLRIRSAFMDKVRRFLIDSGFVDVDTPTLFRRTPGGAKEFIVPSRTPGKFYSLVQSPQQLKQLLMVGGLDKYFQIARCYRDEGARQDRQPEFVQVDLELSFVNRPMVKDLVEEMLASAWPQHLGRLTIPFQSITYETAARKYGSDKPDLRFKNEIVNLTSTLKQAFSREFLDKFLSRVTDSAKAIVFTVEEGKSVSTEQLRQLSNQIVDDLRTSNPEVDFMLSHFVTDDQGQVKSSLLRKCPDSLVSAVCSQMQVSKPRQVGVIACGNDEAVTTALGRVRSKLASISMNLDPTEFCFLWVEDFPLFSRNSSGDLESSHHPFTRPQAGQDNLLLTDPLQVKGEHYDLVLNGYEVGGGSIRIHEASLQRQILEDLLRIDVSELSHFLKALEYGCPPHGGIALGVDRLLAVMCNANSVRDVIAFPKTSAGRDVMSDAPCLLTQEETDYYHIAKLMRDLISRICSYHSYIMDLINNCDEIDRDMIADGDENSEFPEPFTLAESRAAGLEQTYVLQLGLSCDRKTLAAALSDQKLAFYDADTLRVTHSLEGSHDNTINGLRWSSLDPAVLYTCSSDSSLKMWDVRANQKANEVKRFPSEGSGGPPKPLLSLDINASDRLLCAGTEQVVRDSFILFWDTRNESRGDLMGGYWDSHEDDVTAVRFYGDSKLASGGTDGIINVFDVAKASEDDALDGSINTESSVQKLAWFNGGSSLAAVTHTEELHLWKDVHDLLGGEMKIFSRDDVCAAIKRKLTHTAYIADCVENKDGLLVVAAGSSCRENPCLRLAYVKNKKKKQQRLKPLSDLRDGAERKKSTDSIVRCCVIDEDRLFTGGEDGVVRLWRSGDQVEKVPDVKTSLKASSEPKKKHKPY